MGGMFSVARVQFRRLFGKREFWFALVASIALFSIAFSELCAHFVGADRGAVPSAAIAWIANMDSLLVFSMHLYYFLIMFVLSSMAFGDAVFLDVKSRHVEHFLVRCSVKSYIASTTFVAFVAGFLVIGIPLLIFQVLSLIVFPVSSEPWAFSGNLLSSLQDYTWIRSHASEALLSELMYEAPYAYNMIFILYDSIWGGLSAVASIALSCCTQKSRLLVIGAPTFVFLLGFFLFRGMLSLQYYLYPNTIYVPLSMAFFVLAPLVVCVLSAMVLLVRLSKRGDLFL